MKLWKVVEKQYAVMTRTAFARGRLTGPPEQTGIGNGVVWTPERPAGHEAPLGIQQTANAVNLGRLDRFPQCKRRQNRRYPFCYHRFPGTWWSKKKDVMGSCSGNFDGAFRMLLTFNLCEIEFLFGGAQIGPTVD